ncbi:hemopexin repeat-containing protein [Paraglaciecola arctica]|uniref:Hemopexin n=1 Tax=Paraglaciecola arctica BSs20135 TaxID=493475 RepID=K6ZAI7_9ALTE|nr:hemopexin repeat-containing protein [Paraglaciecola arctica]GAC20450.1 hypothetical protein GARC_3495 [Paraglaciecola arctica BSs20135]
MKKFISFFGPAILFMAIATGSAHGGDGLAATYGGYSNNPTNNKMYFFDNNRYVRWLSANSKMDKGYPASIVNNWPGVPGNLDASLYAGYSSGAFNNKIYLFKNKQYWRWNLETRKLDSGYPKLIQNGWPGLPDNIDAAVYGGYSASSRNNKLYFFKGAYYYRWDIEKDVLDAGYPKLISANWPGLPNGLDMAVYAGVSTQDRDNKLYFFKGNRYWRWNVEAGRVDANYPLSVTQQWPGLR